MAFVAVLLDMLPMPSIDGVGEVYQWLKNRRSAPGGELLTTSGQGLYFNPRLIPGRGQGVAQWALEAGTVSSPARI
jgi:hypothetical protein